MQSVFLLMRDAVSGWGSALAPRVVEPLRATLGPRAGALRPLHRRESGSVPNVLVPIAPSRDVSVPEQVQRLHDYPPDDLITDIATLGKTTRLWQPVADQPRRWLDGYADAVSAATPLLCDWWPTVRPLVDRETERIGVASVRGALGTLLNTLSRRLTYSDGAFRLDGRRGGTVELGDRRLVLVPSVISPDTLFMHEEAADVLAIAYPVRGQGAAGPTRPGAVDRLGTVLGAPRAALLRHLDVPMTMGALAAHLNVTPGAATRHCDVLARTGLIGRERRGQSVLVSRTDAGSALLELLG